MKTTHLVKVLVFTLIATMSTLAAFGCGDSKGKRQRVDRSIEDTKPEDDGDGGDGTDDTTDTGDQATGATGDDMTAEELRQVEDEQNALTSAGDEIAKEDIAPGAYTLTQVVVTQHFQDDKDLRAIQTASANVTATSLNLAPDQQEGEGAVESAIARVVEIATNFTAPLSSRDNFNRGVMEITQDGKINPVDTTVSSAAGVSPGTDEVSQIDLFLEAPTNNIIPGSTPDGKAIEMTIRRLSETSIRIVMLIKELDAVNGDGTLNRNIILDYSLTESAASTETPPPAEEPPADEVPEA